MYCISVSIYSLCPDPWGGKWQLHFLRSPELGPGPKNITAMKKVQQYWRIPYLKQALFNRIPNISIPLANQVQLECLARGTINILPYSFRFPMPYWDISL